MIKDQEYLSEKDEIKLLSIVKELNSNDKAQILNNIANVRPFLESIQTAMNKVDSNISPIIIHLINLKSIWQGI